MVGFVLGTGENFQNKSVKNWEVFLCLSLSSRGGRGGPARGAQVLQVEDMDSRPWREEGQRKSSGS